MHNDLEFSRIANLKWIPWVGNRFSTLPKENKVLIVGESHYLDNTPDSIEKHNSPNYTREVIEELAIERWYYGTKIFPNLHRALFRNDEFDSFIFWNLVSYYNFIQRPMNTKKERPSYDEYYNSWFTFFEIIRLLKPKTCLFIGTSTANSLEHALQSSDFSTEGVKWEDYISNAYAKTAVLKDKDGNETQLIFIRHTSQMFSWSKWNEYLQQRMHSQLTWFEAQLKNVTI